MALISKMKVNVLPVLSTLNNKKPPSRADHSICSTLATICRA